MKTDYSGKEIENTLINIGISKGDTVFVHSNIGYFGKLTNAEKPKDYFEAFKNAFLNVIGAGGTLVVPTFSYSFCKKEIFIKDETPGVCGLFSEMIRVDSESLRSEDANFSISAIGKNAHYLVSDCPEYSFGSNSFWEKFLNIDGKVCNLNSDAASTYIHYVERVLKVPYRFDKPFHGVSIINKKKYNKVFYHFVYDLDKPQDAPEFSGFDKRAKELGLAITQNLGKGQIVMITARNTFDLVRQEIEKNVRFLLKG